MENLRKIIFFGDSITKGGAPVFERFFKEKYADIKTEIINAGVSGETSRDGLKRIASLTNESPQVIVIGFGMNDWRKGVSKEEFESNIRQMIDKFEEINARVILTTISPCYEGIWKGTNKTVDEYNCIIRNVAREKRIKVADVNSLWKREIKPVIRGLRDAIHPNAKGYTIYCKALLRVVPREHIVILWQYNGREAKCNYRCPYCYYAWAPKDEDYFFGTIEQWKKKFKDFFRKQRLIFYLAFGEPTIGAAFHETVDMIGSEPNWSLRITSNISVWEELKWLANSSLAREGRLNINASFHPLGTTIEEFLQKVLFLREHNIEVPVVYVMYPPFLERFERDFDVFNEHNFLVHVRRFRGWYKNKYYPDAYTEEERQFIAKYCDDATIKYMLNNYPLINKLSYSGMDFMVVDNIGNVGYDSDYFPIYSKYGYNLLGNIVKDNLKLLLEPDSYPGEMEGTVDGVSNLLELNYRQLEKNNVISFARQGGVYHTDKGVFYKNMSKDFNDSRIRAEYYFPARGIKDEYFIFRYLGIRKYSRCLIKKVRKYLISLMPHHRFIGGLLIFIRRLMVR
ncbi:GDSL-type esterase/lipase family protein [Chloroflexota bacterium]